MGMYESFLMVQKCFQEVGNTVIYMLEILNTLHSVTLNYGTITRDSPFRYTFINMEYPSGKSLILAKIPIPEYAYEHCIT